MSSGRHATAIMILYEHWHIVDFAYWAIIVLYSRQIARHKVISYDSYEFMTHNLLR